MRSARPILFAATAAVALLTASVGIADAQVPYEASIKATCNTKTGQYDVVATVSSNLDFAVPVDQGDVSVDAGPTSPVTFSPNPMPAFGSSSASVSIPGDSELVEIGFYVGGEVDNFDDVSLELKGDCVAEATTTTTAAPTTSTTAAAAAAVKAAPAFTG